MPSCAVDISNCASRPVQLLLDTCIIIPCHTLGWVQTNDMYLDLNVVRGDGSSRSVQDLRAQAFRLGYTGIAENHVVLGPLSERDRYQHPPPPPAPSPMAPA